MTNAIKIGVLLLALISAASASRADEPPKVLDAQVQNDSLLQRAYRTRNRHILDFIKECERKNDREGLRDRNFRAELKGKLDLLAMRHLDDLNTEARYCASCERDRAQFNENEIRKLRAMLAASEQNRNYASLQMSMQANPFQMQMNPFEDQQQPGFGGNYFNTAGSMNQGLTGLFSQILGGLLAGNQSYGAGQYGYGHGFLGGPHYGNRWNQNYRNQWRFNQGPVIAGVPSYSYNQIPILAGSANAGTYNYVGPYANVASNHYSLINRSSTPAILPIR
ncbi:MAG: hypothetical protein HC902_02640 [Calothrix sp. SM1_5_4]|nr:hypothetical protein [Calothrix sp. SM1_5_4]